MSNLAVVLRAQKEFAEARAMLEQVLPARQRVLGDDHPDTLVSKRSLATVLEALERNIGTQQA